MEAPRPTERLDDPTQTRLQSTFLKRMGGQNGYLVRIHPIALGDGVIALPRERVVIGRDDSCDIVLVDHDVSRAHASIEFKIGAFILTDLGSTNGTMVNQNKISTTILKSGDFIHVGKSILKFLRGDDIERQYHETVYSMMLNDGLTGIPNRRYFQDALQRELTRSQRHNRPLSLVLFDIDHFKRINDTHGHLAGDVVLRELTERIRSTVRRDEVFARCGGEEFAVILPEATLEQAALFAERIRAIVQANPVKAEDREIPVTISLGVAYTAGEDALSPEALFDRADQKLYAAKQSGRNRVAS